MNRHEAHQAVGQAVLKDRATTHGAPEQSFAAIAHLFNFYLDRRAVKGPLMPFEIGILMTFFKMARATANPTHDDNFVDVAGYAICTPELVQIAKMELAYRENDQKAEEIAGQSEVSTPFHEAVDEEKDDPTDWEDQFVNRIMTSDMPVGIKDYIINLHHDRVKAANKSTEAGPLKLTKEEFFKIIKDTSAGAVAIFDERWRQIHQKGYTAEDDQQYVNQLLRASLSYIHESIYPGAGIDDWPFPIEHFKPTTPERNIAKAGALLAAHLDKLEWKREHGSKFAEEIAGEKFREQTLKSKSGLIFQRGQRAKNPRPDGSCPDCGGFHPPFVKRNPADGQ
jgi:hypothetical protein